MFILWCFSFSRNHLLSMRVSPSLFHSTFLTLTLSFSRRSLYYTTTQAFYIPPTSFAVNPHNLPFTARVVGSARFMSSTIDSTAPAATAPDSSCKENPTLVSLQSKMTELGLDAYIIPTDDPHLSEYVSDAFQRRAFLTGFTGSAGTAMVTTDGGFLWTDSRYFNQANIELDSNHWSLMKMGEKDVPTIPKYLAEQAVSKYNSSKKPYVVGIDPYLHPASFAKELREAFESSTKSEFPDEEDLQIGKIQTTENLVDPLWGSDRPPLPQSKFRILPLKYAGMSVPDKITAVQEKMKEEKATLCVFSALDDVAHFLNLRGSDVECNPVGIAYVTVDVNDGVTIYCDEDKVQNVKDHLKEANIKIAPYETIVDDVKKYCEDTKGKKVWVNTRKTNFAICDVIPEKLLLDKLSPVEEMKACKNEAELEGMRKAHLVDGVAMANFISWLKNEMENGNVIDEVEIDERLTAERAKQEGFFEVSFPTIAGVGSNGAIVHYRADRESPVMKKLDTTQPILIDSGAQYEYGTTDVTRTWHFGDATQEFKEMYTRVLKGHIGLDTMIFPEKTPGFVLDAFARRNLWAIGKDYGHGTGHGVGAALNVHEGPMGISARYVNKEVLKKGMIVSNEPGYYKDGEYGIRIENLLEIVEMENDKEEQEGSRTFLKFEKLTVIPIQKNLILVELMTDAELDWLDEYHEMVYEKVGTELDDGSRAKEWLKEACAKIDRSER